MPDLVPPPHSPTLDAVVAPSPTPGMGATLVHEGARERGTTFRVWAPHADEVRVTGSFCGWNFGLALAHETGGYWSVFVPKVGAGTAYKYKIRNGETWLLRHDPYARAVSHSAGDSLVYDDKPFDWQDDAFVRPAREEMVIYELHVGTFGDGEWGRTATLDAAISRLDYLEALGVNAVELMPVAAFAGDRSWGYNPAHPFAVATAYGGPDALKRFVREAHRRGIAVILDVVYNHLGPSDLDLWQFDGWSENGKGGIYFYNDDRSATPWGDTRPDYGRPEVRQYLRDNARMWLERYRVDGLRLDMALYIRAKDHDPGNVLEDGWNFMCWLCDGLRHDFPHALLIAEDLQRDARLVRPTLYGGAGFDAQWSAGFVHPIRHVLEAYDDADRSARLVAQALAGAYDDDPFRRVIYTESHDEVSNGRQRLASQVGGWHGRKRAALAAALLCTAPGIPMLFQGQAMLLEGWFRDDVAVDWGQPTRVPGFVLLWHDLIALRRNLDGRSAGLTGTGFDVLLLDEAKGLLAYCRSHRDDAVVVVVNLHSHEQSAVVPFPKAGHWHLAVNTDAAVYDPSFANVLCGDVDAGLEDGDNVEAGPIRLGPYAAHVYTMA
ncbi:MAG: alpha amylase C-terminal domain-containing protein [Bacteroidetes bacterium]|nr:alpha amylase C-terminal domain-containing protein [Bacteroidota bacterium]